jgi:hypothetical protein
MRETFKKMWEGGSGIGDKKTGKQMIQNGSRNHKGKKIYL